MNNIQTVQQAVHESEKLRNQNKKIILVGGCFDILHSGHIEFLKNAKKKADFLFVLLESDQYIKKTKGPNRPINSQQIRADILSALKYVDYVIMVPQIWTNDEYDDIIGKLRPALIATTSGDPYRTHKERQAEKIGAKVLDVIQPILDQSTTKIARLLANEI